jgi:hypothetical protein
LTYGTLRRDALYRIGASITAFSTTQRQERRGRSAKAVRLLCADYRLAMSGTRWKPFRRAVSPSVSSTPACGSASVFGRVGRNPTPPGCWRALRSLRANEAQVARSCLDEQTIYRDLDRATGKLYESCVPTMLATIENVSEKAGA